MAEPKVFDEDSFTLVHGAAIPTIATADADATFAQPEADLLNEVKSKLNSVLAALRSANIIAGD